MIKIRAKNSFSSWQIVLFIQIYGNVSHANLKLFTTNKNIEGHVLLLMLRFSRHLVLLIYIIVFYVR